MNYEELYRNLQTLQKTLKDSLAASQKLYKAIGKDSETGDLKNLSKDLAALTDITASQSDTLETMKEAIGQFDSKRYLESGDFTMQMLASCQDKGIDVKGEYPVYEMFPYRVKFDTENQDICIDRKKIHCMRPQSFVNTIKAGQDKLNKASFNALAFANELADAYDLALLKANKPAGTDLYLNSLYKFLAPMSRFRRDYDQQSFAFDLARLYAADLEEIKDGRRFQFGPSRNNSKAIRILDRDGHEQFLATICFYS